MKIAGHTMGTPELSLHQAVELFSGQGFDGIEIIWDDEYRCALSKSASSGNRIELKETLAVNGLGVACLTPYMTGINAPDASMRRRDLEDFFRCMEAAEELGAPCIRVYGGAYQPERDKNLRGDLEKHLVDSLRIMGERLTGTGVTLAVETHFNTLTCSAAETAEIVKRVGHPHVRVLYDQPNLEFSEGEDYQEALALLQDLIVMVHVKDLVYKEGAKQHFTSSKTVTVYESERRTISKIPGKGIIQWPEILASLRSRGFDGWLSLEYERRWYPHNLPPAEEGMLQGLSYIRSILAQLD
jgi:sugar phosphate isomerase/epimerase